MSKPGSTAQKDDTAIKVLQNEIEMYDLIIEDDPKDDKTYYAKATSLVKLRKLTEDKSYDTQALECYNTAIKLTNNKNQLYIIDRSKLYSEMGETHLAIDDIRLLGTLPKAQGLAGRYVDFTVRDITKLDDIKATVKQLLQDGKIDDKLATVLQEHATITAGLVVKVGAHDEKLDKHDAQINKLELLVKQLQTGQQLSNDQITQLELDTTLAKARTEQNTERIEAIEEQIVHLCSREEFESAMNQFDSVTNKIELFGGKIKILEGTQNQQASHLMMIDETLRQSNCYNKQQIKEAYDKLKVESQPLYEYANSFYWAFANYILAYKSIATGTGLPQGIRDKSKFEKFWEKYASNVMTATSYIPVVGGILKAIEDGLTALNDKYQNIKFERKVEKINAVISSFILEEDLQLAIASSALQIAKIKEKDILEQYKPVQQSQEKSSILKQIKSKVEEKVVAFHKKMDDIITEATHISKTIPTPAQKLAIKDVVLFINAIAISNVPLATKDNGNVLDKVIAEFFAQHVQDTNQSIIKVIASNIDDTSGEVKTAANKAVSTNAAHNTNKEEDTKCVVCVVDRIIYDNPLLNYPDLMNAAAKYCGYDRALNLSARLSDELVRAVIANHDEELFLSGLLSLSMDSI